MGSPERCAHNCSVEQVHTAVASDFFIARLALSKHCLLILVHAMGGMANNGVSDVGGHYEQDGAQDPDLADAERRRTSAFVDLFPVERLISF